MLDGVDKRYRLPLVLGDVVLRLRENLLPLQGLRLRVVVIALIGEDKVRAWAWMLQCRWLTSSSASSVFSSMIFCEAS